MSDLPPGAVSLEDDPTPAPVEPAPTEPAAVEPAPIQAAGDEEPEGTVVNPSGEKLVPLSALAAARQKAREKDALIEQLRPKAEKADQVVREWQAVQPIIQRALSAPPPVPVEKPAGPLSPQEAIEYAKDLDLYKPDGTPDVDRAQRLAARNEALAERKAAMMVAPMQLQTVQAQSNANMTAAIAHAQKTKAVDPAILQEVWSIVPPEVSAQPNVAEVLWHVAHSRSMLAGKSAAPVSAPPPPVHTEGTGATKPASVSLSATSQAFRQAADIPVKEYEKISSRYEAGRANSLE